MTPYLQYRLALKLGQVEPEKKKPVKIRPFSKKREKLNRQYSTESKPRWQGKDCRVRSPVCTRKAQGMHHLAGKDTAEKLLDPKNQIPCCNACNTYVEDHDAWARKNGFKVSRLNKKK
jgi:hypothetical protein